MGLITAGNIGFDGNAEANEGGLKLFQPSGRSQRLNPQQKWDLSLTRASQAKRLTFYPEISKW
ncbi:MAG: hypothetical protein DMF68_18900 [Acidobacteria bacterium]|nr:MAG: hypothetical protein DMF68_18900 [Acidobacteriota bacterium]